MSFQSAYWIRLFRIPFFEGMIKLIISWLSEIFLHVFHVLWKIGTIFIWKQNRADCTEVSLHHLKIHCCDPKCDIWLEQLKENLNTHVFKGGFGFWGFFWYIMSHYFKSQEFFSVFCTCIFCEINQLRNLLKVLV